MLRKTVAFVACSVLASGCVLLGDRVIQVRADVISEDGTSLRGCTMGLHSAATDEALDSQADIQPQFLSGFINPPTHGKYYFKVTCPGRTGFYKSDVHDFASPPYLFDLGKVVIRG